VTKEEERKAQLVVRAINSECDEVDAYGYRLPDVQPSEPLPQAIIPKARKFTFIAACVLSAKCEFGQPTDNQANRMAVRKFARDMMVERGMRPSHIMQHLPTVVSLVFCPTDIEIEADRIMHSDAVQDKIQRVAYKRSWFGRLVDKVLHREDFRPTSSG
jgi:hypothetical protein